MDVKDLLQNFGFPVALLAVIFIALSRASVWFGKEIVKPLADRHVKFLDELSAGMANQSQAMQTMSIQQTRHWEFIKEIMDKLEIMMERQDTIVRHLSELTSSHITFRPQEPAQ